MADSLTDATAATGAGTAVRDLIATTPYMGWLGIVFDRYEPDDGTYVHGGVDRSVT